MNKSLNYIYALFCWVLIQAIALQGTAQNISLFFPNALKKPSLDLATGTVLTRLPSGVSTGTIWVVYTSENGVNGYSNSGLSRSVKVFSFLESFIVLEERADEIRAVHSDYVQQLQLLPGHEDNTYWFRKTDMLLWSDCLIKSDVVVGDYLAEFNRKAMVINRLDMISQEMSETGFFNKPAMNAERIDEARSFTILFVYHQKGNYLLLGEAPRVVRHTVKTNIRGWVNRQYLSEWNHHLALEINWENARNRPPAKIYSEMDNAQSYNQNPEFIPPPPGRIVFNEQSNPYKSRAIGELNRFFVLTEGIDMTEQFPKLGVVGEVKLEGFAPGSQCFPTDFPPDLIAAIRGKVNKGTAAMQRVNILFVIDGTYSMEPYSAPIINALQTTMVELMNRSRERETDISYQLGALVFRDQDEAVPFEVSNKGNWTNNVAIMRQFLEEAMVREKNSGRNSTHPEALYHGIHTAINSFQIDPLNTNYLVLIGDAGDNPASYPNIKQTDVITVLDKHNFNLLAYQIHHRDHASKAYDNYRTEVMDIVKEISIRRNKALHNSFDQFVRNCPDARTALGPIFSRFPLTFDNKSFDYSVDDFGITTRLIRSDLYPIIAQFVYPDYEESLSLVDFGKQLSYDLMEIAIKTEENLTLMGLGGFATDELNTVRTIFYGLQLGLTLDEILVLIFQFNEIYEEGYSAYRPQWLQGDQLYHFIAFLNHYQVLDIEDYLRRLIPADQFLDLEIMRQRIYEIWKRILVQELQLVHNDDFHNLRVAQNITYLTGLPAAEIYTRYRNADVLIPSEFPDSLLLTLSLDLIITMGQLKSIQSGQNNLNASFFNAYREYLMSYLRERNIRLNFPQFVDLLTNHFRQYNYNNYPRRTINANRPTAPQFWYYWIDARHLPSEVSSPSQIVLELARQHAN